jgi:hypothetical protein
MKEVANFVVVILILIEAALKRSNLHFFLTVVREEKEKSNP